MKNYGEMAEWSIAVVLKTIEGNTSGGSNPSFSAVLWCNGSTTVFGAVCSSSNLDRTTIFVRKFLFDYFRSNIIRIFPTPPMECRSISE